MIVQDLLNAIQEGIERYPDFRLWKVAVETPLKIDENMKDDMIHDGEGWNYCKCHGFNTYFKELKVFTVNIHY